MTSESPTQHSQGKPSRHLVGKAPEQQGHHHGAPQLRHDVEHAECPVAQDGNGTTETRAVGCQQPLGQGCTATAEQRKALPGDTPVYPFDGGEHTRCEGESTTAVWVSK